MESSFDQKIHNFLSKKAIDFMSYNLLKEVKTTGTDSVTAISDIENAGNLKIKLEPEMDDYEIDNVALEVSKDVYADECIKQEPKLKFQEYSSIQKEALIKTETDEAINDFEEKHEGYFKEWKIKNEDFETSIFPGCVRQDSQGKCRKSTSENSREITDKTSPSSHLWKKLYISGHYSDKTVQETSPERLQYQYTEESKAYLRKFNESECETVNGQNLDIFLNKNSKTVSQLTEHLLQHMNPKELFKCNECYFQTKHKNYLKTHLLRHRKPEEVEMFKCDKCDFKTKHKNYLKTHLLLHRKPEEVQMFKCDKCDYQTRHKHYLKTHLLLHRRPEEVDMFKCVKCDFQTKRKSYLKTHLLMHSVPEEIEMFKCINCDFQTKHKKNLKAHMLRHISPEEVDMFKCDECDFQTVKKSYLKAHLLRHRGLEELDIFKCDECDFQTVKKSYLKAHLRRHRSPAEIDMFKCDECDFQTIKKGYLKSHLRRHRNPEEVVMFKCNKCDFRTKYKNRLKTHLIRHTSPEEVDTM